VINMRLNYVDDVCNGRRFRVIASTLLKIDNSNLPHLHLAPPFKVTHWNFAEFFSIRKLSLSYRVALFA